MNDPREIAVTQINLARHFIQRGENPNRTLDLLWDGYVTVERLKNPREIQTVQSILLNFKTKLGADTFHTLWSSHRSTPQPDWLDTPATLPAAMIQWLAGNTVAVKTAVPDKMGEWRAELARLRADFAGRGADYAIEVAFADALLAILDDQPVSIADDNPYADAVRAAVGAGGVGDK